MKKNDSLSLLIYVLMIGIAVVVGLVILRPMITNSVQSGFGGIPPMAIIVIAIIVGVILNAILLELGHLVGAKIGGYKVRKMLILGLGYKVGKDGKKKFTGGSFDGLTGETAVVPNDVEKSKLTAYVYFPLLFLFIEVVALAACIVISNIDAYKADLPWLSVSAITVLTIGLLILFYNIFPAQLDTTNDGYRLSLVSNPKNRVAYNQKLLAADCRLMGEELPEIAPYEDLTDFTASINNEILYDKLAKEDYDGAIEIAEKAIASEKGVSKGVYGDAVSMKLSLLLFTDKPEAKDYFLNLKLEDKKYIAGMPSMPALRAYLLASAFVEESQSETEVAVAREVSLIKKADEATKEIEEKLYKAALEKADKAHPDWELIPEIPEEETPAEPAEEPKEEPKPEAEEEPKDDGKKE